MYKNSVEVVRTNANISIEFCPHMGEYGEITIDAKHFNEIKEWVEGNFEYYGVVGNNKKLTTLEELGDGGDSSIYRNKAMMLMLDIWKWEDKIYIHFYHSDFSKHYEGDWSEYREVEYIEYAITRMKYLLR